MSTATLSRPSEGRRILIHQSDISTWARCPQAFFLQRSGNPGLQTSALSFGTVMHFALEAFEREFHTGDGWARAKTVAIDTFTFYWHPANIEAVCPKVELWLRGQTWGGLLKIGQEALVWYADWAKEQDETLLATEYGFQVPIEGTWDYDLDQPHILAGSIDRLTAQYVKRQLTLSVDDHKSGKDYVDLRQNLQGTAYCVSPDTPVLMSDMTWRPIGDLVVGDEITAFDEEPTVTTAGVARRHWRTTTIEAAWEVTKEAYRIELSDGNVLIAGRGHRFLAKREGRWRWRTVEDMYENLENPRRKQPGIQIARVLPAATQRNIDYESDDYRAGYIAGATLGDGSINSLSTQPFWQIGVSAEDVQILDRLRWYLHMFGIVVNAATREPDGRGWQRKPIALLHTHSRSHVEQILAMCENGIDSDDYAAGWLAGLFDIDGGISATSGTVSIYQKDVAVLEVVIKRAHQLGYDFRLRPRSVELIGDRTQRVSFIALIQPALCRKIEKLADATMRVLSDVRICSIVPVGLQRLVDITTGTRTYVADGIASHNCYATTRKEFWLGWNGEDGFGERGAELHAKFVGAYRRFRWVGLKKHKVMDGGYRGPNDYDRFALAVDQVVASIKAEIFPLHLSGENCTYCTYREICAGVGVPTAEHGAPPR